MTNAFTIPKQVLTDKERRYFNQSVTQRAGGQARAKAMNGTAVHGLRTKPENKPRDL